MMIPVVNIVDRDHRVLRSRARCSARASATRSGSCFLGPLFVALLAFGPAKYVGPDGAASTQAGRGGRPTAQDARPARRRPSGRRRSAVTSRSRTRSAQLDQHAAQTLRVQERHTRAMRARAWRFVDQARRPPRGSARAPRRCRATSKLTWCKPGAARVEKLRHRVIRRARLEQLERDRAERHEQHAQRAVDRAAPRRRASRRAPPPAARPAHRHRASRSRRVESPVTPAAFEPRSCVLRSRPVGAEHAAQRIAHLAERGARD